MKLMEELQSRGGTILTVRYIMAVEETVDKTKSDRPNTTGKPTLASQELNDSTRLSDFVRHPSVVLHLKLNGTKNVSNDTPLYVQMHH